MLSWAEHGKKLYNLGAWSDLSHRSPDKVGIFGDRNNFSLPSNTSCRRADHKILIHNGGIFVSV